MEKAYDISKVSFDYGRWYDLDPTHRTVSAKEQVWHTIRFTDRYGHEQTGEIRIKDSRLYLYVDDKDPGYVDPYNVIVGSSTNS